MKLALWARVDLVWMGLAFGLAAQAAEPWFLMARHGECHRIESLKRRVPELGDVNDPQGFAALMRRSGRQVDVRQMPVPRGQAVEVVVPDRGLSLVFVTADLCRDFVLR